MIEVRARQERERRREAEATRWKMGARAGEAGATTSASASTGAGVSMSMSMSIGGRSHEDEDGDARVLVLACRRSHGAKRGSTRCELGPADHWAARAVSGQRGRGRMAGTHCCCRLMGGVMGMDADRRCEGGETRWSRYVRCRRRAGQGGTE